MKIKNVLKSKIKDFIFKEWKGCCWREKGWNHPDPLDTGATVYSAAQPVAAESSQTGRRVAGGGWRGQGAVLEVRQGAVWEPRGAVGAGEVELGLGAEEVQDQGMEDALWLPARREIRSGKGLLSN